MRCSYCRLGLVALLGLGLSLLILSDPRSALAQKRLAPVPIGQAGPVNEGSKPQGSQQFIFPDNRNYSQWLEAVVDYLAERKTIPWDTVCGTAQRLLDAENDSFYSVKDPKTGEETGEHYSVKAKINELIGGWPKEGRQFYELTYGPAAETALKEAVRNGFDKPALAELARRYFHTKAGAQAVLLLAGLNLGSGQYAEAAYGFQRLLARPDSDELLPPRVLFKAAVAFKRSGDPRQAEAVAKLWQRLEKKFPRDGLTFGKRTYTLEELKQQLDRPAEMNGRLGEELVAMRYGNPSHTGVGNGGTPFLDPSFAVPMLYNRDPENGGMKDAADWVEQHLALALKQLDRGKGQVAIPAFFPVTADGLILYRAFDGVYAVVAKDGYVAYKGTPSEWVCRAGDRLWMSPTKGGLQSLMAEDDRSTVQMWWQQFWQTRMPSILFENGAVGSLSHDGKLVYFVDDLAVPPPPQLFNRNMGGFPQPVPGGVAGAGSVRGMTEFNRLVAVDLLTGRLKWELGGLAAAPLSEEEEQKSTNTLHLTENSLFLGPPLPLNGKLYVLYERNRQIKLACLNPARVVEVPVAGKKPEQFPEVVWVQNLGAPTTQLSQDSLRRIQPAYLAYADGVLVCPTNCGAVVAVDINARSLLWARTYGSAPDPNTMPGGMVGRGRFRGGFNPMGGVPNGQTLPQDRWRASAPIITNGKVILTAHDAEQIQCLDLRTGEPVWSDRRQKDDLYVGGVYGGKVLVVGKEAVRAYALNGDGKGQPALAWQNLRIGTPTGHGVLSKEGMYYLPLIGNPDEKDSKEPQVWVIDMAAGRVKSKTSIRRKDSGPADPRLALGNLVFHDGQLFSQTAAELTAFPLIELKKQEMARLLKKNPHDPVGLAARAELSLDNGEIQEAIADFHAARQNNPPEAVRRKIREKLYIAYTELLRNKFADGEPYLKEYEALCEVPIDDELTESEKRQKMDERIRRKSLYLSLLAKGREKQGRLVEAFDAYRAFAAIGDSKQLVDIYDEPNAKTRPDVWARGRIDAMIRDAKDPAIRKPLEDRVRTDWEAIRAANDLNRLREFVKVFGPFFPAGREAQLLLAEKLTQTNNDEDLREAQTQLMQLWATAEDSPTQARAVESLARLLTRRGMLEDAVGLYTQLGTRFADVPVREGKTGGDIYGELVTDKRMLPYLEPSRGPTTSRYKIDVQTGAMNRPGIVQTFTLHPEGELFPLFRRLKLTMQMSQTGDGTWTLHVTDRATGEERCKFAGLSPIPTPTGINQGAPSYRIAQANGHLLLLTLGQYAYCFDLAEKRQLWQYNLLGTIQPVGNPPRVEQTGDGDVEFLYEDGWRLRLGRSSVLEPTYACLVTRDGLVALDPVTGQKLWLRSNVSSKVQVFGDARNVFVIDGSRSRVLRAVDGTQRDGVKDFAALVMGKSRVAVLDRLVLLNEGGGSQPRVLRLYDPLTGQDVWKREYPAQAVLIKTLTPQMTGCLSPNGKFEIIESRTGKTLFQGGVGEQDPVHKFDPARVATHMKDASGNLTATHPFLLADAERFYLFLNRAANTTIQQYGVMIRQQPVNGVAYGFDRATGKRLWFTDQEFDNQMILLEQFEELPVIVAAAQGFDPKTRAPTYHIAVLDKQLGKLKYYHRGPQAGFFVSVSTDPKTGVTEFWRYDMRLRIVPDGGAAK